MSDKGKPKDNHKLAFISTNYSYEMSELSIYIL